MTEFLFVILIGTLTFLTLSSRYKILRLEDAMEFKSYEISRLHGMIKKLKGTATIKGTESGRGRAYSVSVLLTEFRNRKDVTLEAFCEEKGISVDRFKQLQRDIDE